MEGHCCVIFLEMPFTPLATSKAIRRLVQTCVTETLFKRYLSACMNCILYASVHSRLGQNTKTKSQLLCDIVIISKTHNASKVMFLGIFMVWELHSYIILAVSFYHTLLIFNGNLPCTIGFE